MSLNPLPVAFAPFAPDLSDYTPGYSDAIWNVEPYPDGYGPLPAWAAVGSALAAAAKGAITVRLLTGSTSIFALSATKAYKLDSSDITWDDVTRLAGGDYGATAYWGLVQYGTYLVATNGTDATQYIDVDSGTNFAALTNAPKGTYCAAMGDHLLLGKIENDPRAVAWSGVNDATYWTYGYRGSDYQTFPDGGDVKGVIGYGNGAVVFQSDKIRVIERTGGNYVFSTRVLHERLGCFAPYSIVQARNQFFWYDQAGFYMGLEGRPIGNERVNRYVEGISTSAGRALIRGCPDPSRDMVWWIIPKADGTTFMLGYDYTHDKWTQSDTQLDLLFAAISPGYTIDGLGTLGYTMDTIPYPFDSPFWQGSGVQTLAGFSTAGAYGYFQDDPQIATFETVDLELATGETGYVNALRITGDMDYSAVTAQTGYREFPGDPITWTTETAADASTGRVWLRARGSTLRFKVNIASSDWSNATSVMAWVRKAGKR